MAQYGYSEYAYYTPQLGTPYLDVAQAPCSSGQAADTVNNLTHLADECGQVWACDGLRSGRYRETDDAGGGSLPTPEHMRRVVCWSVRTRPTSNGGISTSSTTDGGPYILRVRLGGCISAAGTVNFYVIAGPEDAPIGGTNWRQAAAIARGSVSAAANAATFTSSSATEAWLGSASLVVDAGMLSTLKRTVDSLDTSGNTTSVDVYRIAVDVFGYTGTNGIKPRLNGLYIAEYV